MDWDRVTVAVPEVHTNDDEPPELLDAMTKSYNADVSMKFPPVELERVTMTLVALTVRASAREPAAMVKVAAGEVKVT